MSAAHDMSQYLSLFLQEAEEQLETLEHETLKLETEPTIERLQAIFRAAHTLKGSSRAMGFSRFAEVTHEMENLLELLRSSEMPVTAEAVDVIFQCLDALRAMTQNIGSGRGDAQDVGTLVQTLQSLCRRGTKPVKSETVLLDSDAGLPGDICDLLTIAHEEQSVYKARFVLAQDCAMKSVRAMLAIQMATELGEMLHIAPDAEALEQELFDNAFDLYIQTGLETDVLRSKLERLSEVEKIEIMAWPDVLAVNQAQAIQPGIAAAEPPTPILNSQSAIATNRPEPGATIRVDVARLDELMNLVGELVIERTRIAQIGNSLDAKNGAHVEVSALNDRIRHLSRITGSLQEHVMKARMQPIETIFNRLPRTIRDLAQKTGKEIKLEIVGAETELDRSVIEAIGDPLLHILRNCADHGIEQPEARELAGKPRCGVIRLAARHEDHHIVIEIQDDGRGIDVGRVKEKAVASGRLGRSAAEQMSDRDAIQLIFQSGFSTAEQVTEVSGRGVGMDIVRSNLQKLGGVIELESTVGVGSKFTLRLPLTLAIIRGLLVKVAGVVYVIPLGTVIETLLVANKDIGTVHQREVIIARGATTPLIRLRRVFGADESEPAESQFVVIVGLAEQRMGLAVDSLVGEQEVVIKSLNRFCGEVKGINGATILGDGNVALIVDVQGLINQEKA
jgi:two-component system chemotaxis sensor kinase CheA